MKLLVASVFTFLTMFTQTGLSMEVRTADNAAVDAATAIMKADVCELSRNELISHAVRLSGPKHLLDHAPRKSTLESDEDKRIVADALNKLMNADCE